MRIHTIGEVDDIHVDAITRLTGPNKGAEYIHIARSLDFDFDLSIDDTLRFAQLLLNAVESLTAKVRQ